MIENQANVILLISVIIYLFKITFYLYIVDIIKLNTICRYNELERRKNRKTEKTELLGSSSLFKRDFNLQYLLEPEHRYFIGIVNNSNVEKNIKLSVVKNKNLSPRLKKLKKGILVKSPFKKKLVSKSA